MKQFGTIFKFEFKNYIKNKVFVGITIFLVLLIGVVMFIPRITASFDPGESLPTGDKPEMLISSNLDSVETALIESYFKSAFENDYDVKISDESVDSIMSSIISGESECAFILNSLCSYTYYVNNLSMYDSNTAVANELLQTLYRISAMTEAGISADNAGEILAVQVDSVVENLGKDQMQNFFYTYIMIFALYMVILLYGQMVATNVATEKSSRAMELLVTSAKPTSMMFGKVIASCLAGLTQLIAIFGSAFVFFNINKQYWSDNMIFNSIFDMPMSLLLYMLLFFVLGFFIYAFLYGAVGSTASKLEDINTSVMPITMLFIIGFFVVIYSMSSGDVDSLLMKVCSYIPFTSPMAMFTRIAMSTVSPAEIITSVSLLIASVFGVGFISAKIYRVGVLLYGTTPKIGSVIKSVFSKH